MRQMIYMSITALSKMLLRQSALQQQVIELQQQVIVLQRQVNAMTPKNAPDEKIFWHLASDGILSEEAAHSNDVQVLRRFQQWNTAFAKKFIKPYVNPKVFGECLNQMTRGLSTRIGELEREQISAPVQPSGSVQHKVTLKIASRPKATTPMQQLALIP